MMKMSLEALGNVEAVVVRIGGECKERVLRNLLERLNLTEREKRTEKKKAVIRMTKAHKWCEKHGLMVMDLHHTTEVLQDHHILAWKLEAGHLICIHMSLWVPGEPHHTLHSECLLHKCGHHMDLDLHHHLQYQVQVWYQLENRKMMMKCGAWEEEQTKVKLIQQLRRRDTGERRMRSVENLSKELLLERNWDSLKSALKRKMRVKMVTVKVETVVQQVNQVTKIPKKVVLETGLQILLHLLKESKHKEVKVMHAM
jgi:hypothetical protein